MSLNDVLMLMILFGVCAIENVQSCNRKYHFDNRECIKNTRGSEYVGTRNVTQSGQSCVNWADIYEASSENNARFPHDASIADARNFCRLPADSTESHPWCFTHQIAPTADQLLLPSEVCNISLCSTPLCVEAAEGRQVCETCVSGYEFDRGTASCADIDECSVKNGGCDQLCNNSLGGYSCSCAKGYVKSPGLNNTCTDESTEMAAENKSAIIVSTLIVILAVLGGITIGLYLFNKRRNSVQDETEADKQADQNASPLNNMDELKLKQPRSLNDDDMTSNYEELGRRSNIEAVYQALNNEEQQATYENLPRKTRKK